MARPGTLNSWMNNTTIRATARKMMKVARLANELRAHRISFSKKIAINFVWLKALSKLG